MRIIYLTCNIVWVCLIKIWILSNRDCSDYSFSSQSQLQLTFKFSYSESVLVTVQDVKHLYSFTQSIVLIQQKFIVRLDVVRVKYWSRNK
jgi:hypothetical protein